MTKYLSKFTIALLFLFNVHVIEAQLLNQSVLLSGGDDYKKQNIEFSWTMGELATETFENSKIILNSGFQQPLENGTYVGLNLIHTNSYSLYPNPASEHIIIKKASDSGKLQYHIFSLQGVLLLSGVTTEDETKINLEGIKDGILIIKLTESNNNQPQSYKILKISL